MVNGRSTVPNALRGLSTAAIALLLGCGSPKGSAPEKEQVPPEPTATASATATATAAAHAPAPSSAPEPPAPKETPTLVAEHFKTDKDDPYRVFAIDGALMVAYGRRVGRVVGDTIEPLGAELKQSKLSSGVFVVDVGGTYPDRVDVLTVDAGGRVGDPTYLPLTGKGVFRAITPGANGRIHGLARTGESTVLSGEDLVGKGWWLETVRGPDRKLRRQTALEGGCPMEMAMYSQGVANVAVQPSMFGASRAGTIVSIGYQCRGEGKRGVPAAEIWGSDGKSRVVKLPVSEEDFGWLGARELFQGKDDELWFSTDPEDDKRAPALIHYKDGAFEKVEGPGGRIQTITTAPTGELYASDGEVLHRRDEAGWTPVARLDWPRSFHVLAFHEGTFWGAMDQTVYRLKPGVGPAAREGCATPLVYITDVEPNTAGTSKHPKTVEALSTFPEAKDIELLVFRAADRPRLGVAVKSNAQGRSVIEHLRPLLTDVQPRLLCHAPERPRKILVKPAQPK